MSEATDRFKKGMEALVAQVVRDASPDWYTKAYDKRMRDEDGEVYVITSLVLQKGPTGLMLDPIGYDLPGADGAADLYLMPAYDPVATFYHEDGVWRVHCVFPPDPRKPAGPVEATRLDVNREALNRVLDWVADHAVPSV